ncbi:MAG: hypothetical protein AMXMBFR84_45900 [Candidatus Hydrogenedentota bacterium]
MNARRIQIQLLALLLIISSMTLAETATYDPLAISQGRDAACSDFVVTDKDRDREVPIRVYLPDSPEPAPVVLFSHGLGGSKENGVYLASHWSARGYVCVFMQHPGSDESIWKEAPRLQRMSAMRDAASGENFLLRVKDVPAIISQLEKWNVEQGHALSGRMDLAHIGMCGHSFGAVTTQAVSGQTAARARFNFTDPRIKAAIAFSPSSPRVGSPENAFANVSIPWLLMTGTEDISPIGDIDVESRLAVYPALPPGSKYEVVLDGAKHSAFSDRALPGDRNGRNPNHHRVIVALSTAFWDAYLKGEESAKAWLDGDSPRLIMDEKDRWQRK